MFAHSHFFADYLSIAYRAFQVSSPCQQVHRRGILGMQSKLNDL